MNLPLLAHNKKMLNQWAEMAAKKDMVAVCIICRNAEGTTVDMFANGNDGIDSIHENVKNILKGIEMAKEQNRSHSNLRIEK